MRKAAVLLGIFALVMIAGCDQQEQEAQAPEQEANGGPEPGFDVTGLWTEQDGGSTLEFTEAGSYTLNFDPSLSDGTTRLQMESYNRVDNSHLTFTVIMGRASFEVIEVKAIINSSDVLRFELDGKTYRFIKTNS